MSRRLLPFVICALVGCGGNPASPDPNGLTGAFTGAVHDQASGIGTIQANLTEAYGTLSGTWRATGGRFDPESYSVNGSIFQDNTVTFTVCPGICYGDGAGGGSSGGGCLYLMKGTVHQGSIAATYTTFGQCTVARAGSVTLARQ